MNKINTCKNLLTVKTFKINKRDIKFKSTLYKQIILAFTFKFKHFPQQELKFLY